jgi:uncharacterized protein YkwD
MHLFTIAFAAISLCAVYVTAAGPTQEFKDSVLTAHNAARARFNAQSLTWSDTMYPATLQWANTCIFQHSVRLAISVILLEF